MSIVKCLYFVVTLIFVNSLEVESETHAEGSSDGDAQTWLNRSATPLSIDVRRVFLFGRSTCDNTRCYTGQTCDIYTLRGVRYPLCYIPDTTPCSSESCENGGTCSNSRCICLEGFHGSRCETGYTMCSTPRCYNGGTCITVSGGGYRCQCADGFTGVDCKTAVGSCTEHHCLGPNCRCVPSCKHELGFYCISKDGYIGKHCDIGPPSLNCTSSLITLEIPEAFAIEYGIKNTVSLYVSSSLDSSNICLAEYNQELQKYVVNIPYPFTDCGSPALTEQKEIFQSTLWVNRLSGNALYDMPKAVLDFSCKYQNDFSITTAIKPVVDKVVPKISRTDPLDVTLQLCKVPGCSDGCPAHLVVRKGATYTVSEMIHLSVDIPKTRNLDLATEFRRAFLSCSRDGSISSSPVTLIDGCTRSSSLQVNFVQPDSASQTCLSFRVPRLLQCSEVFIHIELSLCRPEHYFSYSCTDGSSYKRCLTRLHKRSLSQVQHHSIGPIVIVEPGVGEDVISIISDDGHSAVYSTSNSTSKRPSPLSEESRFFEIALICGVALSVIALLGFACLSHSRSPKSSFV